MPIEARARQVTFLQERESVLVTAHEPTTKYSSGPRAPALVTLVAPCYAGNIPARYGVFILTKNIKEVVMNGLIEGMSVDELAASCGLCAEVVRRKLRDGSIIGLHVGQEWAIPARECERALERWPMKGGN